MPGHRLTRRPHLESVLPDELAEVHVLTVPTFTTVQRLGVFPVMPAEPRTAWNLLPHSPVDDEHTAANGLDFLECTISLCAALNGRKEVIRGFSNRLLRVWECTKGSRIFRRWSVQQVIIKLSDEMYAELQSVSEDVLEMCYSAERWATEAVESALASRRLPRVRVNYEKPIQSRDE